MFKFQFIFFLAQKIRHIYIFFLAQKIRHIYIFFLYEKYINIAYIFIFLLFIKLACVCVCVCVCYSLNGYMVCHLWFSFYFSNFFKVRVAEDGDPYNVCNKLIFGCMQYAPTRFVMYFVFCADTGPAPTCIILYIIFFLVNSFTFLIKPFL